MKVGIIKKKKKKIMHRKALEHWDQIIKIWNEKGGNKQHATMSHNLLKKQPKYSLSNNEKKKKKVACEWFYRPIPFPSLYNLEFLMLLVQWNNFFFYLNPKLEPNNGSHTDEEDSSDEEVQEAAVPEQFVCIFCECLNLQCLLFCDLLHALSFFSSAGLFLGPHLKFSTSFVELKALVHHRQPYNFFPCGKLENPFLGSLFNSCCLLWWVHSEQSNPKTSCYNSWGLQPR